jgi:hypothetical protein
LPNALAYNVFNGFSEKDTLAMLQLQQTIDIPNILQPLKTSYTSSNEDGYTSEVGQGRPTKDEGDLSPSGDRSRNQ